MTTFWPTKLKCLELPPNHLMEFLVATTHAALHAWTVNNAELLRRLIRNQQVVRSNRIVGST